MVNWLITVLISTVFGALAGMGVGGGSLLLLYLTQIVNLPQGQAKLINLLFFLPAAAIATVFRKKENLPLRDAIVPAVTAGCIAAVIFSIMGRNLDMALMKKLLGGLLILTGLREVFYRPRDAK